MIFFFYIYCYWYCALSCNRSSVHHAKMQKSICHQGIENCDPQFLSGVAPVWLDQHHICSFDVNTKNLAYWLSGSACLFLDVKQRNTHAKYNSMEGMWTRTISCTQNYDCRKYESLLQIWHGLLSVPLVFHAQCIEFTLNVPHKSYHYY